jgi:hypothetical protein
MASATEPSVIEENKRIVRNFAEDVFNRAQRDSAEKTSKLRPDER